MNQFFSSLDQPIFQVLLEVIVWMKIDLKNHANLKSCKLLKVAITK